MKARVLIVLGAVVLMVAIAAIAALSRGSGGQGKTEPSRLLFPQLADQVNSAAVIQVEKGGETVTVSRQGEHWAIDKLDGFPADAAAIRAILVELTQLRTIEPKTENPELYSRIGVQDPAPGAEATRLVVKSDQGATLASLIVGQAGPAVGSGLGRSTRYVRVTGEAKSWLAQGELFLKDQPLDWARRDILSLDSARVAGVDIVAPGAAPVSISRPSKDQTNFAVAAIPEGSQIRWEGAANSTAEALAFFQFDNVKPADQIAWDTGSETVSTYRTFDGLTISLQTIDAEGAAWTRITAGWETPSPSVPQEDQDKAKKEADDLNARLGPWVFAIPAAKAELFRKKMSDLTAPVPAPAGGSPAPQGPPSPGLTVDPVTGLPNPPPPGP